MEENSSPATAVGEEFEREPVPQRALLGFKSFVGMYAGEHTAGTELMIGPLFVAAGVSAFDLLVGLLVGNLLAVLSWTFLTAPIATRARLTLYYQLEKICGRSLVTLYNLANGVMFCFLAGAMITVSATAIGVWVNFPMPALTDVYPNSVGWVLAVLAVGLFTAIVAVYGYAFVARVANIAAPWMTLVFIAFGLVTLRRFIDETNSDIHSLSDLWELANTHIWKGGDPLPGQPKFGFWRVAFFAWFCNMAMHIGMSDLSVFRFARHSWYGISTGSGMFLGHYLAWVAASMLFAFQLQTTHPDSYLVDLVREHSAQYRTADRDALLNGPITTEMIREGMEIESRLVDEGKLKASEKKVATPTPLPGPLADQACGIAGLICVIIAGWTTANPTIYRAGLAFQAIMPHVSRAKVTFFTGLVATIAGMFPAFAMRLLDFVAIYGLLLMPMGAVIFVDFYLLRKFGLKSYYAEVSRKHFNWAAGLTWFLTLGACFAFVRHYGNDKIFFVGLPAWFLAAVLYVVLSKSYQQKVHA